MTVSIMVSIPLELVCDATGGGVGAGLRRVRHPGASSQQLSYTGSMLSGTKYAVETTRMFHSCTSLDRVSKARGCSLYAMFNNYFLEENMGMSLQMLHKLTFSRGERRNGTPLERARATRRPPPLDFPQEADWCEIATFRRLRRAHNWYSLNVIDKLTFAMV
jgi:hypothetical protein